MISVQPINGFRFCVATQPKHSQLKSRNFISGQPLNGDGSTDLIYRTQSWNADGTKDTQTTAQLYTGGDSFQTTAGLAFQGTVFSDHISGTEGNDTIRAGYGNDTVALRRGDDVLDGGYGTDAVILYGNSGNNVFFKEDDGWLTVRSDFGTKRLANIENVIFTDTGNAHSVNEYIIDPDSYLAANPDLISAFGHNDAAAENHYMTNGRFEGRQTGFNVNAYMAGNPDLLTAFGHNKEAAVDHYIDHGRLEGRSLQGFDTVSYMASNSDLIGAFHTNFDAALAHYVDHGFHEGRNTNSFNAQSYMAANPDVAAAVGGNAWLAANHYVATGFSEHRPLSLTLTSPGF